jgi:hypothetical protein
MLKKAINQCSKTKAMHTTSMLSNSNAAFPSSEVKGGNADHIGFLIKRGLKMKTWKKRFFVLKDDKLSYYVKPGVSFQLHHHHHHHHHHFLFVSLSMCSFLYRQRNLLFRTQHQKVLYVYVLPNFAYMF